MLIEKIQLINAPNEIEIHKSGSASYYPHLGLISIATYLRNTISNIEIEVIDGSITPLSEILSRINADLVGISVLTPTYVPALKIAQAAKSGGAITVLGNDHATNLFREILARREEVDYVICGDYGEIPLASLIKHLRGQSKVENVPNLSYRSSQGIQVNKVNAALTKIGTMATPVDYDRNGFARYHLDAVPAPDRQFIEKQDVYFMNYQRDYGKFHLGPVKQTTINIARGCGWGESESRRCNFCDIYDLTKRVVSPEKAWADARTLVEQYGYTFLYEVCDSFSSFAVQPDDYVEQLIRTKPVDINPEWFVYARASELYRKDVITRFRKLNVKRVNIGIDSADDSVLRGMSKGASDKVNRQAVKMCGDAGIQMYISFVFGSIGETLSSLEATYRFIEEISGGENIVAIDPSVLLPLPNAPAWKYLMKPDEGRQVAAKIGFVPNYRRSYQAKYEGVDILPTDELAQDWVDVFCDCKYEDIINVRDRILTLQEEQEFVFGGFGVRGF
jgi:radical SAM superfamily enzyme YgiQ (UPF0313 family)